MCDGLRFSRVFRAPVNECSVPGMGGMPWLYARLDSVLLDRRSLMVIYRVLFSSAFFGVLTAQSTGPLSGTINGQPLPETVLNVPRQSAVNAFVLARQRKPASDADEKEVDAKWHQIQCDRLKDAMMRAARKAVKQQLGVVVTEQDLEAAKKIVQLRDPVGQAAALRNRAAAILEAISAVYDQHQDPAQVY